MQQSILLSKFTMRRWHPFLGPVNELATIAVQNDTKLTSTEKNF